MMEGMTDLTARLAAAPPPPDDPGWTVVVPLKEPSVGKSRLVGIEPVRRADAALAMALDTLAAAAAAVGPGRVVVVTGSRTIGAAARALGVRVVPDPGEGLDAAFLAGADAARADRPATGVAALMGDLPCLRPADLRAVLAAAERHPRAVVADADGSGTTVLTAASGVALQPRFGVGSAARHAADAVVLDAPTSVRLDVDDAPSWRRTLASRPGPRTSALAAVAAAAGRHAAGA